MSNPKLTTYLDGAIIRSHNRRTVVKRHEGRIWIEITAFQPPELWSPDLLRGKVSRLRRNLPMQGAEDLLWALVYGMAPEDTEKINIQYFKKSK